VVRKQASERRDDTAAATPGHSITGSVARVGNGRTVEDDKKLTPGRCRF
jgi:hypothetical protein